MTATHYRIQVNTKPDFMGLAMWDSDKTAFDTPVSENAWSEDIPYGDSTLTPGQKYWWRVKLWDSEENEKEWSEEEAYFTMVKEAQQVFGGYIG